MMYRYNKILVAMDFSDTDHSVLAYASHIARMAQSAHIYFLHVADDLKIPDSIKKEYPVLSESLDEYALKRMQQKTQDFFSNLENINLKFEVAEGEVLNTLLNTVRIKDIDLVLVGKANESEYDNLLGEKLARKAPCSVLIIPNGTKPKYEKITVACDFSNHSIDALDVTRAFTDAAGLKSFVCLNVYDIPSGYYKTGKSYEQFDEIMQKNATQQFITMMKLLDMKKVNPHLELVMAKKPARAIAQYVENNETDLLVVGARGRAPGAGILLGSVTEQLIQTLNIPVLAVKKKGTGMALLDVILNA
jgi:nucleotide-binding universal stress UspA family protein